MNQNSNHFMDTLITIFSTVLLVLLFYFIVKKVDPDFSINIKRIICSNCKTKLPIIRMPKSLKQAVWGGNTCPNCGIDVDKFGNSIV